MFPTSIVPVPVVTTGSSAIRGCQAPQSPHTAPSAVQEISAERARADAWLLLDACLDLLAGFLAGLIRGNFCSATCRCRASTCFRTWLVWRMLICSADCSRCLAARGTPGSYSPSSPGSCQVELGPEVPDLFRARLAVDRAAAQRSCELGSALMARRPDAGKKSAPAAPPTG